MPSPRRRSKLTGDYLFDPRLGGTGRYVSAATGRIVSTNTVLSVMEGQIEQARGNIRGICEQLANEQINLAQWQTAMKDEMRSIHTKTAALSKGGWAQMSQADWGALGRISRDQYAFLENFAKEIYEGKQPIFNLAGEISGNFLRRADLYGQAGVTTYWEMEKRTAQGAGADYEARELDPAVVKHCDCCIDQAALGWRTIASGDIYPIGACTCTTNCRCRKKFGTMIDGEIVEI